MKFKIQRWEHVIGAGETEHTDEPLEKSDFHAGNAG
jgi:hypothetical protein